MLSDEVIEKVVDRLVRRIEQGNTYVIEQIGKSINKLGTLTPTKAQQLVQIMKFGGDYDKITRKLAEITKLNVKDIKKIFQEVAKSDYQFAKQFYDYRNKKYIPWDENTTLRNQIDALAKITADNYVDMSRSKLLGFGIKNKKGKIIFRNIKDTYNKLLDEAVINVGQGKENFDSAMRRQLKEISESGLKVVYEYTAKNKIGKLVKRQRLMRLDSVFRMQLQGALRDMRNETQRQFGEEFGADGIEISVHANPAPDHEKVQGRQFSNEEFDNFQSDKKATTYDGIVFDPEFKGHDRRSIGQYNCYHYIFSIVLGINKPQYSNEKLQQMIDANKKGFDFDGKHYTMYEGQQLQRKIETELRKQKDAQIMGRSTNDEDMINESQLKINQLTRKYKELSKASGLKSQIQRASVGGYHKVAIKE